MGVPEQPLSARNYMPCLVKFSQRAFNHLLLSDLCVLCG
jgi:hypothetical protein